MLEFELNGHSYRAGKLSAFQQLHLSRKIAPILPRLLPAFALLAGRGEEEAPLLNLPDLANAVGPLAQALAEMSDADCEYVFGVSLSVVSRLQGQAWASVWNGPSKSPMFDDIDLSAMTQIVVKVIADNLGPFMQGLVAKVQASSPVTQ